MEALLKFVVDSKDINPNLYSDVVSGLIKPCSILDKAMEKYYG